MFKNSILTSVSLLASVVLMVSCSGKSKRGEISSNADPAQEIQRLEGEIQAGYNNHLDVLAPKDFSKSQKALNEAKEDLQDGESQSDVLDNVSIAQGQLDEAQKVAESRKPAIEGAINARSMALQAGAKSDPKNQSSLKEIDDDLRDEVGSLNKLSAEEISQFQSRYMDLELASLKATNLGKAIAVVEGERSNAKKYAPNTLKRAEVDIKNAENVITSERRSPENFRAAVVKANASASLLNAVLDQNKKAGWKLDEVTSLKLVNQNKTIAGLEQDLDRADETSAAMNETIEQQNARLRASGGAIAIQKAIESARKEFSKEEAEVFQQGDKLVIRLKTINFASGSSALPAESMTILSKVRTVAEELDPKAVLVEGHTDSVGSAAINSKISQGRAEAVASYFGSNGIDQEIVKAVGLGFQKPIASNKTASGRSVNRRVDVIITPSASQPKERTAQ